MALENGVIKYIENCPTAYQAVEYQKKLLQEAGFCELKESDDVSIVPGGKYYITRNGSALIAFTLPQDFGTELPPFHIIASHTDTPCFKIKNNPEMNVEGSYVKLNVESYGSSILHTWFDRPLSVAGRVFYEENGEIASKNVDFDEDFCMIPSLAIHMDRDINKGHEWKIQKELLPLISTKPGASIACVIADKTGIPADKLLSHDLYLYNRQSASFWGADKEFLSAPRLDDSLCAHLSLKALIDSKETAAKSINLHVLFDNEEVGSSSAEGAMSTFLKNTLERIAYSLSHSFEELGRSLSQSFMFSADNAHAMHPNYPEKCDPTNKPVLGGGVVLKFAGNKKYTTDAASAAYTKLLAQSCNVPIQIFHNNSDIPGGSTLGNLSLHQIACSCADIGIAQLAMHSSYETCALHDLDAFYKLSLALYTK